MLKHLCVLHRFESEILARPTCEELEQRTAHATARELGRRCNPRNGADEIRSDSIRFDHQKMWLADFFGWSQKNIDGVECSKWCRIKDVNSNTNISWSLVAAFYMFLSGIPHVFLLDSSSSSLRSCQPFMTPQDPPNRNRSESLWSCLFCHNSQSLGKLKDAGRNCSGASAFTLSALSVGYGQWNVSGTTGHLRQFSGKKQILCHSICIFFVNQVQ